MTFRVGQKVVCIDASPGAVNGFSDLEKGRVYEISGIDPESLTLGLYLTGVPLRPHPNIRFKAPCAWAATRFRPLVERKTDITIFTEILRKVTRKSKADA